MEEVSIRKVRKSLKETLMQTLSDLQIDLTKYKKIIIKPNLCNYLHASTASTTDVVFIDVLVQIITKENKEASTYVVESDSLGKLADIAFKLLGYNTLEEKYDNVKLLNLTNDEKVKKTFKGFYFDDFEYPKIFEGEHLFISVPKLKTFEGVFDFMTCALKNQFGCDPYPKKWIYHDDLSKVIYDLNKLFTPDLVLVDALIAMEGVGPTNGIPKKMDLVIGGRMPSSVDVVCAKVMGLPYKKVKHLKFALKHGALGSDNINIIGDKLNNVKEQFILPKKSVLERILKI